MDDWFWTQDRNLSIVGYCTQIVSTTNQIYLVIDYIPPNQYRVINRKLWTLLNIFNTSEHIQPLLPTTILNRKQYVPPKSLSKDSCSSLFQFAELFFFAKNRTNSLWIKTTVLTTPQRCDYPPVTNRLLVGFDFDTLGGMTFSSPGFTRQVLDGPIREFRSFRRRGVVFFLQKNRWMDHETSPN